MCARRPTVRAASIPFTPGMWMSRKKSAGECAATTWSMSRPFSISWTTASSGQSFARRVLSCERSSGSSSAMTAVGFTPGSGLSGGAGDPRRFLRRIIRVFARGFVGRREVERRDHPARSVLLEDEPRRGAVERLQPLADVRKPHASALLGKDAGARVRNRDLQPRALLARADHDLAGFAARVDPVLHRVLDE